MRRILTQAAHAAVKAKGSVFEALFRRLVPRLGRPKAIWAVAHRFLHGGVRYEERGYRPNKKAVRQRANRLIQHLRRLGYQVQITAAQEGPLV